MRTISVCVPVFGTEKYLLKCLESISKQNFPSLEVIVINDCSVGISEEGFSCKEIIKEAKKKFKLKIKYIEHKYNKGVLEARRTAVYNASAPYIVQVDSDDTIPAGALKALYDAAIKTDACIVQGNANIEIPECVTEEEKNIKLETFSKRLNNTSTDIKPLLGEEIIKSIMVNHEHNGFLWGKIFKTELYKKAFDFIPHMYCILADDFIQFFWLSYFAKKFVKINDYVYNYNLDIGVSSSKEIQTIDRWEKICSAASVFTALYTVINENHIVLSKDLADSIVSSSYIYAAQNIKYLYKNVRKDLVDEAYSLMCDFWGDKLIHDLEVLLTKQGQLNIKKGGLKKV